MIAEVLAILVQIWNLIWPFHIVTQWEVGNRYRFGRMWKTVGPGLYITIPWFWHIEDVRVVPAIISTGRCDITLSDGRTLSYNATAWATVVDANKAVNEVDDYKETSEEILASVLSDKLGEVDASRLTPNKRGRLFSDLQKWVAQEAIEKGIEITKVRFKSFVIPTRTYRLLVDAGTQTPTW